MIHRRRAFGSKLEGLIMRIALAFVLVSTACGGDDTPRADPSPSAKPTSSDHAAAIDAKPKPKPIDLSFGPGYEMRRPITDGTLAIVPIVATGPVPPDHYLTLSDGLARHEVTVREIGRNDEFQVDQVRIRNRSHEPLFVMTGEMIFDGLQDRILAEDRVIAPGKSVRVSVRCVEQGREAGHLEFHASNVLVELAVRQAAIHQTQTEVWATVDLINQRHHVAPPTKTYREVALMQSGELAARRDRLARALAALPDRSRLVGLAQVQSGHVVTIERFATPELYGALEAELLGSYVASDDAQPHEGRTFLPDDVRALAHGSVSRETAASFVAVTRP
jgi:hypothetical protein